MEEHEIDIVINPDGTLEIDLIGYKGKACEADLAKISASLGVKMLSKRKREYYEDAKVRVKEKN